MDFTSVSWLILLIFSVRSVHGVTVTTSVGDIIGFEEEWGDKTVRKFRGIPYAEGPVGDLRFRPPVPKKPFTVPFQANRFGSPCPQMKQFFVQFVLTMERPLNLEMSEDCLNLNIYVREGGEAKKAVMVWIHGGSFTFGSGMEYDGSNLAALGDVIVVTINYRLALLGFFTTGDETATGNYGLLDQHLALKWVQKHIEAFGGDKDRVTIFGESAGAGAVTWHMLSPSNKGLFHRVIAESGTALANWGLPDPEIVKQYSKLVIEKLGCTNSDSKETMTCLRNLSTDFFDGPEDGYPYRPEYFEEKFVAGPRVDGDFFPYSPTSRLPNRRMEDQPFFKSLDFMIGVNKYEGSPLLSLISEQIYNARTNRSLYDGVPKEEFYRNVKIWGVLGENAAVVDALWWLYSTSVNGNTKDVMQVKELLQFIGDTLFYDGTMKFIKRHAAATRKKSGSSFLYNFLAKPSKAVGSISDLMPPEPWNDGSVHGDELGYLFGNATMKDNKELESGEAELADAMTAYWTNFAKTGNPNEPASVPYQWHQFKLEEEKYIEFDIKNAQVSFRTNTFFRNKYVSFWQDVLPLLQGDHFVESYNMTDTTEAKDSNSREAKTEL